MRHLAIVHEYLGMLPGVRDADTHNGEWERLSGQASQLLAGVGEAYARSYAEMNAGTATLAIRKGELGGAEQESQIRRAMGRIEEASRVMASLDDFRGQAYANALLARGHFQVGMERTTAKYPRDARAGRAAFEAMYMHSRTALNVGMRVRTDPIPAGAAACYAAEALLWLARGAEFRYGSLERQCKKILFFAELGRKFLRGSHRRIMVARCEFIRSSALQLMADNAAPPERSAILRRAAIARVKCFRVLVRHGEVADQHLIELGRRLDVVLQSPLERATL